jgi:hypothetical protein
VLVYAVGPVLLREVGSRLPAQLQGETFTIGLFDMMVDMRDSDWKDVEKILVLMRSALTMFDCRWEVD